MALAFGITSYRIALSKSPTFDEPMEAVAAWVHLRRGDHRMSPENPPLWMYWTALANDRTARHPDHKSPEWQGGSRHTVVMLTMVDDHS